MIQIQIKFKTFEHINIINNLIYIENILHFLKCTSYQKVTLPEKVKKITVIRSPHIDKKSREQFEMKRLKYLVIIKLPNLTKARLFIEIMKNCYFIGTQIEIYIKSLDFYKK